MSDLIDRQAALDAVNAYLGLSAVSRTIQNMMSIQEILENLPSAEPEHLVKESGDLVKDLVNDCISRQDAVKTMYDACEDIDHESLHIDVVVDALENLPSASPDLSTYSDKLWKIAYERGKKEGMQHLHDYQVEWLKSHDDITLEPQLEEMIIRFLHDTTNCLLIEEEGEEE